MAFADKTSERVNQANQCHPTTRAGETAMWMNELHLILNEMKKGAGGQAHRTCHETLQRCRLCAERGMLAHHRISVGKLNLSRVSSCQQ